MAVKDWAHTIKRDAVAVYLVARDPRTPWYAKALAIFVAGYALSPIDLIPDFIPVLGLLDDVILVPLGIMLVVWLVPAQVMIDCRQSAGLMAARPASRVATAIIVCVWTAAIALTMWLAYRYFDPPQSN